MNTPQIRGFRLQYICGTRKTKGSRSIHSKGDLVMVIGMKIADLLPDVKREVLPHKKQAEPDGPGSACVG